MTNATKLATLTDEIKSVQNLVINGGFNTSDTIYTDIVGKLVDQLLVSLPDSVISPAPSFT